MEITWYQIAKEMLGVEILITPAHLLMTLYYLEDKM